MRNIKIVADSSANMLTLDGVDFAVAPLKIVAAEKEFVDDGALNVQDLLTFFESYKGTSRTSCPNSSDWLESFGDAEEVFCVAITSGLSGSYNAARVATDLYESEHEGRRVHVIDSLSAGPELQLIVEKLYELVLADRSFDEMVTEIGLYQQHTGLVFMLESLKNFAANGRVSPAVAKLAGILGIRIVGKASDKGTLEPLDKCRGEARALDKIVEHLKEEGLRNGRVCIAHCVNEPTAEKLKTMLSAQLPDVQVTITTCRGLCSYYAEKGGMLVGFEKR